MAEIHSFTGKTRGTHKEIYFCGICGSRSFKIFIEGASSELSVECSNCEAYQDWAEVKDISEDS